MDLRQLAYVVAVAEAGSFRGGADDLGVAQPSVSQAVRALEVELGVELFIRTPTGAVPTAAGRALLEAARQTLRDAENARAAVAAVRGLEHGRLDLVCLSTLAVAPTSEFVGLLRRAHPGIAVRLRQPERADEVVELVRTGACELGITELSAVTGELVEHELRVQDFVLLVPAGAELPRRIPIERLAGLPLVTAPAGTSTRRQLDDALAAVGATPTIAVETDHRESIIALVAAGAGSALLPRSIAVPPTPGTEVREVTPRVRRRIGIIRRAAGLSPAAAAFLEVAGVSGAPRHERPSARRR